MRIPINNIDYIYRERERESEREREMRIPTNNIHIFR
jgi:hypothetical protein